MDLSWGSVQTETVKLQIQVYLVRHYFESKFPISLKFGFSFKANLHNEPLKNDIR